MEVGWASENPHLLELINEITTEMPNFALKLDENSKNVLNWYELTSTRTHWTNPQIAATKIMATANLLSIFNENIFLVCSQTIRYKKSVLNRLNPNHINKLNKVECLAWSSKWNWIERHWEKIHLIAIYRNKRAPFISPSWTHAGRCKTIAMNR